MGEQAAVANFTTQHDQREPDETCIFLSPTTRRQPMTYFMYPGLDAPNLRTFLQSNQASNACIQKALDDIYRLTPCPSAHDISDLTYPEDLSSHISDEVFFEEESLGLVETFLNSTNDETVLDQVADETVLDEVPLEESAFNETQRTVFSDCDRFAKVKIESVLPKKKKRKGFSKFLVSLCKCGGLGDKKDKISPSTEL